MLLKIIIVGESGVGKTKLLQRYIDGTFNEESKNTIGIDFKAIMREFDGLNAKIHFYDTAGQERFRSLSNKNFQNTDIAILVYDITKRETFDRLEYWYDLIKDSSPVDNLILLIGNKIDLKGARVISNEEGTIFAQKRQMYFFEMSAKTNEEECVTKAFDVIITKGLETLQKKSFEMAEYEKSFIARPLVRITKEEPRKKDCC